ncbi:hypothetical protein [Brenneria tiliae]|uniref:Uncharacterized protein n=1 Tax=Brenneria tiliae TaxID=2914984 RepID=A0ABT0MQG2_9GAMM|nr:hypothetical protein [Brenneria tiliae]MCL2892088.1 hypothetical protein [Brenneria tiliae]
MSVLPLILMVIFIVIFFTCFVCFFIKKRIPFHDVRGSVLFGNMLFFDNITLSNIAAVAFSFAYLAGLFVEWERYHDVDSLKGFVTGWAGFMFLLFHCRCFSQRDVEKDSGYAFIKEFFMVWKLGPSFIFLWFSRVSYLYFLYKVTFS